MLSGAVAVSQQKPPISPPDTWAVTFYGDLPLLNLPGSRSLEHHSLCLSFPLLSLLLLLYLSAVQLVLSSPGQQAPSGSLVSLLTAYRPLTDGFQAGHVQPSLTTSRRSSDSLRTASNRLHLYRSRSGPRRRLRPWRWRIIRYFRSGKMEWISIPN